MQLQENGLLMWCLLLLTGCHSKRSCIVTHFRCCWSLLLKNGARIRVTTGARDYQSVEIVKGLTENDILIKPQL